MRREGRALTESFFVHGMLAGAMIFMAGLLTPPPKMIRLDFSMLEQAAVPAPKVETEQKVAEALPPVPPPAKPEPVQEKAKQVLPKPKPVKARAPSVAAVEPVPPPAPTTNTSAPETAATFHEQFASVPRGEDLTAAGVEEYRRTNFKAIRDSIFANLHYPILARRKGWSGKVDVAFMIQPDGNVSELRIQASSGYPVLDEQALDAIRRSAPFTPPRIAALLVMPVTFQLN